MSTLPVRSQSNRLTAQRKLLGLSTSRIAIYSSRWSNPRYLLRRQIAMLQALGVRFDIVFIPGEQVL